MSQRFLDRGQLVGYDFEEKLLIVTMSDKTADKMRADGWNVQTSDEVGSFVSISLGEVKDGDHDQGEAPGQVGTAGEGSGNPG